VCCFGLLHAPGLETLISGSNCRALLRMSRLPARSLASELAYVEREHALVAKRRAELTAQLASHDAADASAASSHECRLSRTKVARRAMARRLARLAATTATLAVAKRCAGMQGLEPGGTRGFNLLLCSRRLVHCTVYVHD